MIGRSGAPKEADQPEACQQIVRNTLHARHPCQGAGWKEIAPTDASAPGRSHQPCGGYRGTPSPSTLAGCYADYSIGQDRLKAMCDGTRRDHQMRGTANQSLIEMANGPIEETNYPGL